MKVARNSFVAVVRPDEERRVLIAAMLSLFEGLPVLHIKPSESPAERRLFEFMGHACDTGAPYFSVPATDVWGHADPARTKLTFLVDDEPLLQLAVSEVQMSALLRAGGLLVTADRVLETASVLGGEANGFLIGVWSQKPFG